MMLNLDRRPITDSLGIMPAPRLLPSNAELAKMVDEGWTHADIAAHVEKTTGHKISRSAVSAALSRAGLTKPTPRYKKEIPWRVKEEHLADYPARMLRLLGRVRTGQELSPDDRTRLDAWMGQLSDWDAVVGYCPAVGFLYVEADEIGDWDDGIPVRSRTISEDEIIKK